MAVINRKTRFATKGIRFQRLNGDGTIATAKRFLGFANTVDLTGALDASDSAELTIKVDANPAQVKLVDFSDIVDKSRVTVEEAIVALNTASFDGITFSKDAKTTRLKGVYAMAGKKIQVAGPLAAALDFGDCVKHGGNGLVWRSFFNDETISIGLPKDIKDREEIDQEGALGTITRMIIGAMLQGLSPVVTLKVKDYYLLEMVQGGKLDRVTGSYNPPLSNESEHPSFVMEIYGPIYGVGSNKLGDMVGYEELLIRTSIGMEGDVPAEAKAWATYAFNCTSTEYTDEEGVKFPSYQETPLSLEQFDALKVNQIDIGE